MAATHWFKIGDAYTFAASHGLDADAERIRRLLVHSTFRKPHVVRKGHLVDLFESRGLLDEFVAQYWPGRHTPRGERTHASYLEQKASNESLLRGEPPSEDETDEPLAGPDEEAPFDSASFALEAHLRDFILANISQIPISGTRLRLYRDTGGRDGREYPTDVGPIDILAIDDAGGLFVFELKLERGPDRALGQLARYMGWVKVHLAGGQAVRGIVVARSIDEKLRYAACVIPNVVLLEYEVSFKLRDVGTVTQQPNPAMEPTARGSSS